MADAVLGQAAKVGGHRGSIGRDKDTVVGDRGHQDLLVWRVQEFAVVPPL
jgi:hypothetical protein